MRLRVHATARFHQWRMRTWLAKCLSVLGSCVRAEVGDAGRMRYSTLAYGVDPSPAQSFRKAFSVTLGFVALVLTTLTVTWALYTYVGGLSLTRAPSDLRAVAFVQPTTLAKIETRPAFDTQAVAFNDRFIVRSDDPPTGSLPKTDRFEIASIAPTIEIPVQPETAPAPPQPAQAASIPLWSWPEVAKDQGF